MSVSAAKGTESYDCQRVFDGLKSSAQIVRNVLQSNAICWSVKCLRDSVPSDLRAGVDRIFQNLKEGLIGVTPQRVSDFASGMRRDVEWIMNPLSEEDLKFGYSSPARAKSGVCDLVALEERSVAADQAAQPAAAAEADEPAVEPGSIRVRPAHAGDLLDLGQTRAELFVSRQGTSSDLAATQEFERPELPPRSLIEMRENAKEKYTEAHRCAQRVFLFSCFVFTCGLSYFCVRR